MLVSHTAFDRVAIERAYDRYGLPVPRWTWLDSSRVVRRAWPQFAQSGYGLAEMAVHCGITYRPHDATEDARAMAGVLLRAMRKSGLAVTEWLTRVRRPIIDGPEGRIARAGVEGGPLAGDVVVFTGVLSMPRRDAAALAASVGCKVKEGSKAVGADVTMLVVG